MRIKKADKKFNRPGLNSLPDEHVAPAAILSPRHARLRSGIPYVKTGIEIPGQAGNDVAGWVFHPVRIA